MEAQKSIENMKFEEALSELEDIVKKIDTGQESLEQAIASFERGVALKNYCEQKLQEARLKIEKVIKVDNQEVQLEEINL